MYFGRFVEYMVIHTLLITHITLYGEAMPRGRTNLFEVDMSEMAKRLFVQSLFP